MFDINTIVNAAINAAVQEAMMGHNTDTLVLAQRCDALERELDTLKQRVKALEAKPLEQALVDERAMVEALNTQEWFWEKLTSKAKEVADAAAEEAIVDHCNSYDHDDYDSLAGKVNELEDDSSLKEAIKDVLDNVSFDVRVSF